jgi:hypothetical protein
MTEITPRPQSPEGAKSYTPTMHYSDVQGIWIGWSADLHPVCGQPGSHWIATTDDPADLDRPGVPACMKCADWLARVAASAAR